MQWSSWGQVVGQTHIVVNHLRGALSQIICSYILMPVAFLMGADWADSPLVAELLGIKIFLNEFVAYEQLATYKKNRLSGLEEWSGGRKQWISVRAMSCHAGEWAEQLGGTLCLGRGK